MANEIEKSHVKHKAGGGTIKSPSTINKLTRIIFADDLEGSIDKWKEISLKKYLKQSALDLCASLIYGQPTNGNIPSGISTTTAGYTNYSGISTLTSSAPPATSLVSSPVSGGARFNGTVYFEDTPDMSAYQRAYQTYEEMQRILKEYKWVRLAELYEIADIPGIEYVSNSWGWNELTNVNIFPSGKGYILQLPPVKPRS